jgi:hypothetical protein
MPFSSTLKVTSICGTPRGAGAMTVNLPSSRQSLVRLRSPSNTLIETVVWWSSYVGKVCYLFTGIRMFRGMGFVMTPPAVSMPSVSCVTSSSNISFGLCATLAADDAALDGGSVRHGLVGVDPLGWLLAVEVLPEQLLHLGDPGTTSNKHDLVDVRLLEPGVGDGLPDGAPPASS